MRDCVCRLVVTIAAVMQVLTQLRRSRSVAASSCGSASPFWSLASNRSGKDMAETTSGSAWMAGLRCA